MHTVKVQSTNVLVCNIAFVFVKELFSYAFKLSVFCIHILPFSVRSGNISENSWAVKTETIVTCVSPNRSFLIITDPGVSSFSSGVIKYNQSLSSLFKHN